MKMICTSGGIECNGSSNGLWNARYNSPDLTHCSWIQVMLRNVLLKGYSLELIDFQGMKGVRKRRKSSFVKSRCKILGKA